MSKIPNFWQFFNLASDPTIPTMYWDAYSYEERLKKICDKIWAILRYLKLVMELMNEFDDRLTALEELYNALEKRVTELEELFVDLSDIIDSIEKLFDIIAKDYDNTQTYVVGNYVIFAKKFWRCTTAVTEPENFDPEKWEQVRVGTELEDLRKRIDDIEEIVNNLEALLNVIARDYDESATYVAGAYCIHDKKLYKCAITISQPETWNPAHWTQTIVMDEILGIIQRITNLEAHELSLHEYADAASAKTASAATGHEYWICYVPETEP